MGDYEQSLRYYQQLLSRYPAGADSPEYAMLRNQEGQVREDLGDYPAALAAYQQAEAILKHHQAPESLLVVELNLGSVLSLLGRHAEALSILTKVREASANSSSGGVFSLQRYFEGRALAGLGRHGEALQAFNDAEQQVMAAENQRYLAWILSAKAASLEALGQFGEANQQLHRFIAVHEQLDHWQNEQVASRLRVEFDVAQREAENAALKAEQALQQAQLQGYEARRRWQVVAFALASALLLVVGGLAWRQIRKARRYHYLAMTDELTGLANRRHIEALSRSLHDEAREEEQPLALLVFDIDYFKRINDSFGHVVGDEVLVQVCKVVKAALRTQDQVGRTGGEEFLVLMPNTRLAAALQIAERLRQVVERLDLAMVAVGLSATISIGVTERRPGDLAVKALIERADNALYRAKDGGRNRVEAEP